MRKFKWTRLPCVVASRAAILRQTVNWPHAQKNRPRPILLFGRAFWEKLINFEHLVEQGMIGAADLGLFHFVETAEEAWARLAEHYGFDESGTQAGELAEDV